MSSDDDISGKLGEKLLQGWTMLANSCQTCEKIPLMCDKSGRRHCISCESSPTMDSPTLVTTEEDFISVEQPAPPELVTRTDPINKAKSPEGRNSRKNGPTERYFTIAVDAERVGKPTKETIATTKKKVEGKNTKEKQEIEEKDKEKKKEKKKQKQREKRKEKSRKKRLEKEEAKGDAKPSNPPVSLHEYKEEENDSKISQKENVSQAQSSASSIQRAKDDIIPKASTLEREENDLTETQKSETTEGSRMQETKGIIDTEPPVEKSSQGEETVVEITAKTTIPLPIEWAETQSVPQSIATPPGPSAASDGKDKDSHNELIPSNLPAIKKLEDGIISELFKYCGRPSARLHGPSSFGMISSKPVDSDLLHRMYIKFKALYAMNEQSGLPLNPDFASTVNDQLGHVLEQAVGYLDRDPRKETYNVVCMILDLQTSLKPSSKDGRGLLVNVFSESRCPTCMR